MNPFQKYLVVVCAINVVSCLDYSYLMFEPYKYNGSTNFKFTATFESTYLLESYKINYKSFSLIMCLSLAFRNVSTQIIRYEVIDTMTVDCKSYSRLGFESTDIVLPSIKSIIYLKIYNIWKENGVEHYFEKINDTTWVEKRNGTIYHTLSFISKNNDKVILFRKSNTSFYVQLDSTSAKWDYNLSTIVTYLYGGKWFS